MSRKIEETIVDNHFICIYSSFRGIFKSPQPNPFKGELDFPSFQLLGINPSFPLTVSASEHRELNITDAKKTLPGKLWKNDSAFKLSSFFLTPYATEVKEFQVEKRVFKLEDGFTHNNGRKSHATLVYSPFGEIGVPPWCNRYSIIPPSQVWTHLDSWLSSPHRIFSVGGSALYPEGIIDAREGYNIGKEIITTLEERYQTNLSF